MNPAASPHVPNGSITGWGQDGIIRTNGGGGTIELLRVSANGRYGIYSTVAARCATALSSATGNVGIHHQHDVEVDDCISSGNATHGIQAGTARTFGVA